MGESLRIRRHVDRHRRTYLLGEVLTNLETCPFVQEMLRRHGFESEVMPRVQVGFWDETDWKSDPPWDIFVPRKSFFGDEDDEELAINFIHKVFHILDGDYPV